MMKTHRSYMQNSVFEVQRVWLIDLVGDGSE